MVRLDTSFLIDLVEGKDAAREVMEVPVTRDDNFDRIDDLHVRSY